MHKLVYGALVVLPMTIAVAASAPVPGSGAATTGPAQRDTPAERLAARRAYLDEQHPQWRTLSATGVLTQLAKAGRQLIAHATSSGTSASPAWAAFQGNLTFVKSPSGQAVSLQRQADCSLAYRISDYTLSFTAPTFQVTSTTPNYQDVLHAAAGLTTRADAFPRGCADPLPGIGSRRGFFLGKTSQNLYMFAATGYNNVAGSDTLLYTTVDATSLTVHSFNGDLSVAHIASMTAGDLNGDGLADPVVLDAMSGSVTVWLAHADGTLGAPVRYATTGSKTRAAVLADVDGDGKLDLVVAGSSFDTNGVEQQGIAVLIGRGDGTFQPATTFAVSAPPGGSAPSTLVAADLRGTGHPDIVGTNGLVLLNDGSGHFTQSATWAFPALTASGVYGLNMAVGDLDEDGRLDVAVNDGAAIRLYLGRGDGTFVPGRAYASSGDNVGYITATDLDGDGHLDLYVGLANGGVFVGDQYTYDTAYALMGRGDGSFSGAPMLPFVDNGHNVIDLDRDGNLDGVGLNDDRSFTTYLGDGQGGFVSKATLPVATITLNGTPFPLNSVDSYDLADVNGDSNPDLVFVGSNFMARNNTSAFLTPGFLIALGDGHGGLAPPVFLPAPTFVPGNDIDVNLLLSNVRLADINGDGKADLVYTYADTSYLTHQRTVGVAVQLGNGNGTFQAPSALPFFSFADTSSFNQTANVVRFADVNGDGKLDLVLVTQTATIDHQVAGYRSNIQVALGHGDGTFAAPVSVPGPDVFAYAYGATVPVAIADMNGDGLPDVVILGGSSSYNAQIAIALGNGDGTFRTPSRITLAAQYLNNGQQLAAADFDGDGKADVLFANPYGISGIVVGNGDGTLAPLGTTDAYLPNRTIGIPLLGATRVVDFNHDAKPDVIVGDVLLLSATATTAGAADFSLNAHSTTGTLRAGQSVQDALTLTPTGGFTGTASFSCSGLPSGSTCSFTPASVAVGGSATASTTLTIATTGPTMGVIIGSIDPRVPTTLLVGFGATLALRRRSTDRSRKRPGAVALVALTSLALAGCGGDSSSSATDGTGASATASTPTGTYTIVVTATSGSVSHMLNYVLTVQ